MFFFLKGFFFLCNSISFILLCFGPGNVQYQSTSHYVFLVLSYTFHNFINVLNYSAFILFLHTGSFMQVFLPVGLSSGNLCLEKYWAIASDFSLPKMLVAWLSCWSENFLNQWSTWSMQIRSPDVGFGVFVSGQRKFTVTGSAWPLAFPEG